MQFEKELNDLQKKMQGRELLSKMFENYHEVINQIKENRELMN